MHKDIVLLAKSKKYGAYCIAGKDINTGEWIRLVSEDDTIRNAIIPSDFIYNDNTEAKVLDIIRVKVKEIEDENKILHQPENYILDNEYYLTKLDGKGPYDLNYMLDDDKLIFFNTSKLVTKDEIKEIKNVKSLMLIHAEFVIVSKKDSKSLWAIVNYNGIAYNYLTITDIEFTKKYYENITTCLLLRNIDLVISLGEEYYGSHYKLIASVLDTPNSWEFLFKLKNQKNL